MSNLNVFVVKGFVDSDIPLLSQSFKMADKISGMAHHLPEDQCTNLIYA